jgi:hypothetical protein
VIGEYRAIVIEDKLAKIGWLLPAAAEPAFQYVPVSFHAGIAYVSGQLPKEDCRNSP